MDLHWNKIPREVKERLKKERLLPILFLIGIYSSAFARPLEKSSTCEIPLQSVYGEIGGNGNGLICSKPHSRQF